MRCDGDSDHFVGNSELEILAHRLDLIEGVPFTSQELCHQFRLEGDQSLLKLADVFLTLYIKKRREQVATNAKEEACTKFGAAIGEETKFFTYGLTESKCFTTINGQWTDVNP